MGLKTGIDATFAPRRSSSAGEGARWLAGPTGVTVWQGASGRQIAHTVYTLIGCPGLVDAVYLLVHRTPEQRKLLAVAQTETPVASLNLARVREMGARLGANEVHVHACASAKSRARVERDLSLVLAGGEYPAAH